MRLLAVLVIGFCLNVGQVWAGCAWVLWGYQMDMPLENMNRTGFNMKEAYETKAECDKEMIRRDKMEREADSRATQRGERAETQQFFRCFPDTIDPRAPKSK